MVYGGQSHGGLCRVWFLRPLHQGVETVSRNCELHSVDVYCYEVLVYVFQVFPEEEAEEELALAAGISIVCDWVGVLIFFGLSN